MTSVGLSLFNYQDDVRSNKHKMSVIVYRRQTQTQTQTYTHTYISDTHVRKFRHIFAVHSLSTKELNFPSSQNRNNAMPSPIPRFMTTLIKYRLKTVAISKSFEATPWIYSDLCRSHMKLSHEWWWVWMGGGGEGVVVTAELEASISVSWYNILHSFPVYINQCTQPAASRV